MAGTRTGRPPRVARRSGTMAGRRCVHRRCHRRAAGRQASSPRSRPARSVDVLVLNAEPAPARSALPTWVEDHVPSSNSRQEPGSAGAGRASPDAGQAIRPDHPDRLRSRGPAAPSRSAYATAKNAQIGLTRSWARETRPVGLNVNTARRASALSSGTPMSARGQERLPRFCAGRPDGTPEDIACAVSFFASEDAASSPASGIVVDGGAAWPPDHRHRCDPRLRGRRG